MNPRLSLLFLLGLLATSAAMAGEEPRYNQVELSIEASAEVDNDTLVAELYIQHQAKTAAEAAERVNAAIGWGVGKAKAVDTVEVRTLDYTTNPVYSQRPRSSGGEPFTPEITAWRVSQAMRLQSTDADGRRPRWTRSTSTGPPTRPRAPASGPSPWPNRPSPIWRRAGP